MSKNLLTRLLNKVIINKTNDCWEWQGAKNNIGYGMIRDDDKMRTTHRVSYEEHTNTTIPCGMCVCHSCDNPCCVNPAHLWLGTHKQNQQDMISKGRSNSFGGTTRKGSFQPKTECPHCNRLISNNLINKWHNENCKQNTNV